MSVRALIGHDHELEYFEIDGERYGATVFHKRADGTSCACSVFWGKREAPIWRATSITPLTLEPSIRCLQCGDHGWIREGRWVPA